MKRLFMVLAWAFCITKAGAQGIQFEQGLSWRQIKEKAESEKEYIFLDCFATWCEACREMNKTYLNKKVESYFKDKFVSVKVQMDSSGQDDVEVKKWYADAHVIMQQYKIASFPSFLFFSPDGKLVHKGIGFKSPDDFIRLATDASDPGRQYYTLLRSYQQGNKNLPFLPYLAKTAQALGDKEQAHAIAEDYIDNYLLQLKDEDLYAKDNLEFIGSFSQSSKDRGFNLFYHHAGRVDSIIRKGYSQDVVDYIISKEEIDPKLWPGNRNVTEKPDWDKLASVIAEKYNKDYADRTVLGAQLRWYSYEKDWPELAKYNIQKIEKYGLDTSGMGKFFLNNMIWDVIFMHSNDRSVLDKGIQWMRIILQTTEPQDPVDIDTYANLLYKVGRTQEAISWEERAVRLETDNAAKNGIAPNKTFEETLEKIRKGIPTWAVR